MFSFQFKIWVFFQAWPWLSLPWSTARTLTRADINLALLWSLKLKNWLFKLKQIKMHPKARQISNPLKRNYSSINFLILLTLSFTKKDVHWKQDLLFIWKWNSSLLKSRQIKRTLITGLWLIEALQNIFFPFHCRQD